MYGHLSGGPRRQVGSGLSAGCKSSGGWVRKEESRAESSRAWGGQGAAETSRRGKALEWSLTLSSDRCLSSGSQPGASATPALGIPSSCSPEPTSPPRPEPNPAGSVHTPPTRSLLLQEGGTPVLFFCTLDEISYFNLMM